MNNMLALSRKKDESIIIGDQIEVVVLGVEGDTVRLGIQAPKHISIHRKEIYLQIQEENKAASSSKAIKDIQTLFKK